MQTLFAILYLIATITVKSTKVCIVFLAAAYVLNSFKFSGCVVYPINNCILNCDFQKRIVLIEYLSEIFIFWNCKFFLLHEKNPIFIHSIKFHYFALFITLITVWHDLTLKCKYIVNVFVTFETIILFRTDLLEKGIKSSIFKVSFQ